MRLTDGLAAIAAGHFANISFFNAREIAEERVADGVAFLDRQFGRDNWEHEIRTGNLDMRYDTTCMMGQICGSYNREACEENGILFNRSPVHLGFFADRLVSWALLDEIWKKKMKERFDEFNARRREHPELDLIAA